MKNPYGNLDNVVYVVMCTAGKYELFEERPVASFTNREDAQTWCDRANEYGKWMADRAIESRDEGRYRSSTQTQYDWAIEGSPGQLEQWRAELDSELSDWDWFQYYTRELSLMLNPYDDQVYSACYEIAIKYTVVEVPADLAELEKLKRKIEQLEEELKEATTCSGCGEGAGYVCHFCM